MRDPIDRRAPLPLTRRESIKLAGGAAALFLSGSSLPFGAGATEEPVDCVVRPQQTEGPFFVDEKLNRSDIRSDPVDGSLCAGVPLAISFLVSGQRNGACSALPGAAVDLWHCDAEGIYSDVEGPGSDRKFLRGYQLTDASGTARFTTIYPGWYPGRAVHVHFKIRSGRSEFTSQLYFDDALSDRIFVQAPYARRAGRPRNADDGIYSRDGEALTLRLEPAESGYLARFSVALKA